VTAAGYKNIHGLDVAMNNPLGMGCLQPIRDLDSKVQQSAGIEPPFDTVLQCRAIEKLHGDK
jgi:hypothetical protein